MAFQDVWKHKALDAIASLLAAGIDTNIKYEEFNTAWEELGKSFSGVFGTYRKKLNYDVWVAFGSVTGRAMSSYPVAANSATANSLQKLYNVRTTNEAVLSRLMVHFFHQLSANKGDSLATLSLNLCGWARSLKWCSYEGKNMSVLSRAIAIEEKEFHAERDLVPPTATTDIIPLVPPTATTNIILGTAHRDHGH